MDKERLEELREEVTRHRAFIDDHAMNTSTEDDVLELIDAEIVRQSVTDEAVQRAIGWQEAEKESAQNDWERAGAEWRMEPGTQEQHDERMAAFDLAIQALRQMRKPSK